jgi:hypothetical protein
MHIRVTKLRLVLAAFVLILSGVGLATVLSPLVGSAFATAGQIVNVADRTASYTARVDATGALKTAGTAAPTLPRQPFHMAGFVFNNQSGSWLTTPTTATLALTDLSVENPPSNTVSTLLWLHQIASSSQDSCATSTPQRLVLNQSVRPGDTANVGLSTPIVLKPFSSGQPYCLRAYAVAPSGGASGGGIGVALTGYVPTGTLTLTGAQGLPSPGGAAVPRRW